jgi:hypothetical protein
VVGNFHEKAGQVKVVLAVSARKADCRPTAGVKILPSLLSASSPNRHASIRTLCGAIAPVPAGAAISESNCTASAFRGVRSLPTPQSPELDDLQ